MEASRMIATLFIDAVLCVRCTHGRQMMTAQWESCALYMSASLLLVVVAAIATHYIAFRIRVRAPRAAQMLRRSLHATQVACACKFGCGVAPTWPLGTIQHLSKDFLAGLEFLYGQQCDEQGECGPCISPSIIDDCMMPSRARHWVEHHAPHLQCHRRG
jgi:hypothetical protein